MGFNGCSFVWSQLESVLNYLSECPGLNDEEQAIVKSIVTGSGTGGLDMDDDSLGRDIVILLCFAALVKSLAYYLCKTKNKVVC